jgi:hypothetical protein
MSERCTHLDFVAAVRATGRRKPIACAVWTEICKE